MSIDLNDWEALLLWTVLAEGGTAYRPDLDKRKLLPSDDAQHLAALAKAGLIVREKRAGQGTGYWIELTEKGWARAPDLFDAPLPDSKIGAKVLHAWLRRLQLYMRAQNVALADILGPQRPPCRDDEPPAEPPDQPPPFALPDHQALRARIRTACLDLAGGALNTRVLLRDLRAKLPDIDRPTLDAALKRMEQGDEVSLMPLDNRVEIGEADRAAALHVGREPRHIVWVVR